MMHKGVAVGAGAGLLVLAFLAGIWFASPAPDAPDAPGAAPVPGPARPGAPVPAPSPARTAPAPGAAGTDARAPTASAASASAAPAPVPPGAAAHTSPDAVAAPGAGTRMDAQERRKMSAAVQAKVAALRAKGADVTLEDTHRLMDDIEALGQGQFDPRYFATMRKILEYSARVQVLNKELSQLGTQTTPAANARKMALLAEIRDLADRIHNGTQALQSYTPGALAPTLP